MLNADSCPLWYGNTYGIFLPQMAGGGSMMLDRVLVAYLMVGFAIQLIHPVDAAGRLFHTRPTSNSKPQAFTESTATNSAPSPSPSAGTINATWENLYVVTEGADGEIVQPG